MWFIFYQNWRKKQPGFKKWYHDDSETSFDFIGDFITLRNSIQPGSPQTIGAVFMSDNTRCFGLNLLFLFERVGFVMDLKTKN